MFVLILISLCGLRVQAQGIDSDVHDKVLAARAEAIKVIQAYSQNLSYDRNDREVAARMADLLGKAGIIKAVGVIQETCEKNPLVEANAGWISQIISLCDRGLSASKNELTEIFIHEAYHLYEGVYYIPKNYPEVYQKIKDAPETKIQYTQLLEASEKRAATIELEIMQKTYGCIFIDTIYFKNLLGLKKNKDYFICK